MERTVTLTRQELYNLVWSKPMTAIAAGFGVSSVAFAKHCTKLEVPRPGRGYWQRLARGLKPDREPLPRAGKGVPASVELVRHEKAARPARLKEPLPIVEVPDSLTRPHPVVKRLREELRGLTRYGPGLRSIRGSGHAVLKVSKDTERRALQILDALLKAMAARGHGIRFEERPPGGRQFVLEVVIGGRGIEVWLAERLAQKAHVETADEKAYKARYGWSHSPRFDQTPSGELMLEADAPWNAGTRHRWRDTDGRGLEDRLGEVVVGLEMIAAAWVEHERKAEEHRKAAERAERERKMRALRGAHYEALAKDLTSMAEAADLAAKIHRFLERVQGGMPEGARSQEFSAWLRWGLDYATQLDPLSKPEGIAKRMEPDLSKADHSWAG